MQRYNPKEIEPKWQKIWEETGTYTADLNSKKPKYIAMSMFNYPSGAGIHIGHAMNYTISDVKARFKRQQGFESYHPVGWDAFGLPAENYAIKSGVSPQESMTTIIPGYHKQYKAMGWSNDWEKEIATHLPEYYKWTQWIFAQMFKHGLAYQDSRMQWWCPIDKTVLANEQVIDGKCWRHDSPDDPPAEKREVKQWFFKITDYADELLDAIDDLDWSESVKLAQKNWIGKSVGAEVDFKVRDSAERIKVFTTAHDTIYGVTFMVVAPEHELVSELTTAEQKNAIENYVREAEKKTEVERQANKDKTGVFTGSCAINPINGKEVPVWIADYVLGDYGTGAVMAVPGEDERDHEFAQKFDLEIIYTTEQQEFVDYGDIKAAREKFVLANSGEFDGMNFRDGRQKILDKLVALGVGKEKVNYRMNDWSVSRQRYWGAPIPVIHCQACKERIEREARVINFYHQDIWDKIAGRKKTVETRADNPEEPERRFADVKAGGYLKLVNKTTGEILYALVRKTSRYENLAALFVHKETLAAVHGGEIPASLDELEIGYAALAPGYSEKINANGLVAWEFELIDPGIHLVQDENLPVVLPELDVYAPTGDGRSALARAKDWLEVDCPKCGGPAERETDTLDTYICSSWYFLRYFDPHNQQQAFGSDIANKWMPIDFYNGGDHATAHMLYARFVTRFFAKIGLLNESEPFQQFLFNGKVTAPDGKMFSKSKGNGIDPLEIIDQGYGADALRTYLMFASPLDLWTRWDSQGVPGTYRFLNRLWNLVADYNAAQTVELNTNQQLAIQRAIHPAIKKITDDIEENRYNTAIAAAMTCVNEFYKLKREAFGKHDVWQQALEDIVACIAPFAPHIAEELWHQLGHSTSVHVDSWPSYDEKYLASEKITMVVQVNGKVRAQLELPTAADEATVTAAAKADEKVQAHIAGKEIIKTIYVPKKLLNFVAK